MSYWFPQQRQGRALAIYAGVGNLAPGAFSLILPLALNWYGLSVSYVAWLVFLGIFPTSVAFTTWAWALGRTTAGRLATTMYLIPPTTILLAFVILGEVPPLVAIIGGALSIAGVVIAQSRSAPPAPVVAQPETPPA